MSTRHFDRSDELEAEYSAEVAALHGSTFASDEPLRVPPCPVELGWVGSNEDSDCPMCAGDVCLRCRRASRSCGHDVIDRHDPRVRYASIEARYGVELPTLVRLPDGREVPAVPCECGDGSCTECDDRGMRSAGAP